MGWLENAILTGLRVGWQFLDVVKPVRTIDELARLAVGLWNREDEQAMDQDLHAQLAAAQLARRAVVRTGGDEEALAKVDERINVMSTFSSLAPAQYDVLAGSISTAVGGQPVVGRRVAALVPIGEGRTLATSMLRALRTAPAGMFGVPRDPGQTDLIRGRLEGQREALALVRRSLSTQQQPENVVSQVNVLLDARRAALDVATAVLATRRSGGASPGRVSERRTSAPMPAPNLPTARPAVGQETPQRIDISTGEDRRR